jgi:hypothetical protein
MSAAPQRCDLVSFFVSTILPPPERTPIWTASSNF